MTQSWRNKGPKHKHVISHLITPSLFWISGSKNVPAGGGKQSGWEGPQSIPQVHPIPRETAFILETIYIVQTVHFPGIRWMKTAFIQQRVLINHQGVFWGKSRSPVSSHVISIFLDIPFQGFWANEWHGIWRKRWKMQKTVGQMRIFRNMFNCLCSITSIRTISVGLWCLCFLPLCLQLCQTATRWSFAAEVWLNGKYIWFLVFCFFCFLHNSHWPPP